jgi:hypothetical protein
VAARHPAPLQPLGCRIPRQQLLRDQVVPKAPSALTPPLVEVSRLVLLALAVAWLYAHVAQLQAFTGAVSARRTPGARYTLGGVVSENAAGLLT